ncbi:NUDIX domain-containing protein [Cloacibacterium normanense]|uniref:NUDIX hydrolase n=1 Tax=Cloacibacterium normanense TaxID=237258 RepID=UPI0035B37D96
MNFKEIIINNSKKAYEMYVPHISVDTVIFGFNGDQLKVLLLKMKFNHQYFLPGGYMKKDENLESAAIRILRERTQLDKIFLQEFAVFSELNRSEEAFKDFPDDLWHKKRFISVGYYALVNHKDVSPIGDELSESCDWIILDELESQNITMDHKQIIEKALNTLREQISYKPIGLNLLPKKFTLSELQKLYEAILGRTLNRGNFYRKIKNIGILKKLDEKRKGGAHKAPDLYTFDQENYFKILENGINNW